MQLLSGAFDVAFTVLRRAEGSDSTTRLDLQRLDHECLPAVKLRAQSSLADLHSRFLCKHRDRSQRRPVTVTTNPIVSTRDNLRKQSCAEHFVSYPNRIDLDCYP